MSRKGSPAICQFVPHRAGGVGLITMGKAENNAAKSVKEDEVDSTTPLTIMCNKDS